MKNSKVLVGFLLLICMACSNVKETPKGLKYTVVRAGDGVAVKSGKFLILNLYYKDGKDSVWMDSRKRPSPMIVLVQDTSNIRNEQGVEEIFRYLTKGDSVTFALDAQTLFEKSFRAPLPPKVEPKSTFTFFMSVKDVYDSAQVMKMQQEAMAKENERYIRGQKEQLTKDDKEIADYIKKNNITAVRDSSGVWFSISKEGSGKRPNQTQTVEVTYVGKTLADGKIFDESKKPVSFPLSRLIRGWQIGFPLLKTGTKATLYIPSSLAWGATGNPPKIPANANVIFDVELFGAKDTQK